jgi:hypothetical protein
VSLLAGLVLFGCNQPLGNNGSDGESAPPPEPPAGLQQLDTISDGTTSSFGRGMTMSPSFAAISDTSDASPSNGKGIVHIYDRNTSPWTHIDTVEPVSDPNWPSHTFFYFGTALAMTDDYLVVGTPSYKEDGTVGVGIVQVFAYNASTGGWDYMQSLRAASPAEGEEFGGRLDIDGTSLIASAPVADYYDGSSTHTSHGEVYIFELDGSDVWQRSQLQPETHDGTLNFGWEVAV